jgi:tRNA threonylcarbamoyl adenosine modification protein YeaZ
VLRNGFVPGSVLNGSRQLTTETPMLTLAIDQSTTITSLALLDDTRLLAEQAWDEDRKRDQRLFVALPEFLTGAGIDLARVELFAVGLGPGSFSGIRMAVAAFSGLAIPGNKAVDGVSSAEALAHDVLGETGADEVVVVGDARRGRLWVGRFARQAPPQAGATSFTLVKAEDLGSMLGPPAVLVTSDWDRLGTCLASLALPRTTLIRERRVPRAQTVGALTFRKQGPSPAPATGAAGCRSVPSPIYLHPPVFIEPRFEATES